MLTPMSRLALTAALVPLVGAAAAEHSDDVRFGIALGVATNSTLTVENPTSPRVEDGANGEPWRFTGGLVHRFGAATASAPIAGFEVFYQKETYHLADPIAGSRFRLSSTTFGVDLLAGYAVVVPSHPRLRIEGAVFGGYFLQQQDLASPTTSLMLDGDGWDVGARTSLLYTCADGWETGLELRYLLLCNSSADLTGGTVQIDTHGLLLGLTLGHRL